MTNPRFQVTHLDSIPAIVSPHPEGDRAPVRAHLGIEAFGVNTYSAAAAGDPIIGCHDHAEADDPQHEEMYLVLRGTARFNLDDEVVDAPAGTVIHVPNLTVVREATAVEPGTTVLVVGGERGAAFAVSEWDAAAATASV